MTRTPSVPDAQSFDSGRALVFALGVGATAHGGGGAVEPGAHV